MIWNADGGRSIRGGDEVVFRIFCGCLTLTNGECNEWSILGGGEEGGVRILIVGIWDSLKKTKFLNKIHWNKNLRFVYGWSGKWFR